MHPKNNQNLEMLAVVAKGLGELKEKVVFVGGATIGLYLSDPGTSEPRPTDDVDCVVEAASRAKYSELEERLRRLGFQHKTGEGEPICRWQFSGISVDVMPADSKILGFENRWYPDGMANAAKTTLPDGQEIAVFSLPYLTASKIEAFLDRGRGDFVASVDLEDIVTLADGCADFQTRIVQAPKKVRAYIAKHFKGFLADDRFQDALPGHLLGPSPTGRTERILTIVREIVGPSKWPTPLRVRP
jgi:predicted nucleotidyltransferase